jgi:predicted O-methyltransferase YrrM
MTDVAERTGVNDPAYLAFLTERLPELRRHRLPWWDRTRRCKYDTLRHCLSHRRIDPTGLLLEFGVYRGFSARLIGRRHPSRRLFGFDSFEGFPVDGRKDWRGNFSTEGRMPEVPRNVTLIKGYFEDTLPPFVARHAGEHAALIHVDCDIYSSTRTIFHHCRPLIRPGCIIVFDELIHYDRFMHNEILAFWEFLRDTGVEFEWMATRDGVLPIEEFLNPSPQTRAFISHMGRWRDAGYDQAAAVRITAVP